MADINALWNKAKEELLGSRSKANASSTQYLDNKRLFDIPDRGSIKRAPATGFNSGVDFTPYTGSYENPYQRAGIGDITRPTPQFDVTTAPRSAMQGIQVGLEQVGKALENLNPSKIADSLAGFAKENVVSFGRFANSNPILGSALNLQMDIAEKVLPQNMKDTVSQYQSEFQKSMTPGDILNVATAIPVGGELLAGARGTLKAGKAILPAVKEITEATAKEVVEGVAKSGTSRFVNTDVAKLLFKEGWGGSASLEKSMLTVAEEGGSLMVGKVVKTTAADVARQILKTGIKVLEPAKEALSGATRAGLTVYASQLPRLVIDPEGAKRIAEFKLPLSEQQRFIADLTLGVITPINLGKSILLSDILKGASFVRESAATAAVSRAIDDVFGDSTKLFGNGLDEAAGLSKSQLNNIIQQVMKERKVAMTYDNVVTHINEMFGQGSAGFESYIKSLEKLGITNSPFSWKGLTKDQAVKHWELWRVNGGKLFFKDGADLDNQFMALLTQRQTIEDIKRGDKILDKLLPAPGQTSPARVFPETIYEASGKKIPLLPGKTQEEVLLEMAKGSSKYEVGVTGKKVLNELDSLEANRAMGIPEPVASEIRVVKQSVGKVEITNFVTKEGDVSVLPFGDKFMSTPSRYSLGYVPIPLGGEKFMSNKLGELIVDLQKAFPNATKFVTKQNPYKLYADIEANLTNSITQRYGDDAERILKAIEEKQAEGISILPMGKLKMKELGLPNVRDISWTELERIAPGLGRVTREAYIRPFAESGFTPGIVDRLRAAPSFGHLVDSVSRIYNTLRFTINPAFHAQQFSELPLFGVLRAIDRPNNPARAAYFKSIVKFPLNGLSKGDKELAEVLHGKGLMDVVQAGEAFAKAEGYEEVKKVLAFKAEFLPALEKEFAKMPVFQKELAENGYDIYKVSRASETLNDIIKDPDKIGQLIAAAKKAAITDPNGDIYYAIRNAVSQAKDQASLLTLYDPYRSGLEKQIHAILFPFSYSKKLYSEYVRWLTGGSLARAQGSALAAQGLNAIGQNEDLKNNPMFKEAMVVSPLSPFYPLINVNPNEPLKTSVMGGFTPAVRMAGELATKGETDPTYRLGGLRFWSKDIPALKDQLLPSTQTQKSKETKANKKAEIELEMERIKKQIKGF